MFQAKVNSQTEMIQTDFTVLTFTSLGLLVFNHFHAKLSYLYFHPFEVVSHYRDTQLQEGEQFSNLFNLRRNNCNFFV